ncbi:MAG: folate-binding protein YgfZ [Alphaproteobacteria bacterium]|nr:folate-binding protein YgfZ [Alphaproteobacteria bacterium]
MSRIMPQTLTCIKLKNRGLVHIEGADRRDFLQGLITNDIHKLTPGEAIYACLLTPQGKFLHDFFVVERERGISLDCEGGERAQDLFRLLSLYRLRKDVQISVEPENTVYAILGGAPADISAFKDPRHPDMGYRSFDKPDAPEGTFEIWDTLRIERVIPDGSRDLTVGSSTMDEAQMDSLHAVDYKKGCYIGQELTARMHYRGLGKKHLKCVNISNLPPGAVLRSTCGDIGLALVRDANLNPDDPA